MDLCTGGELFDRICEKGSFYEEDACEIIRTVVDAVAYLHEQNIVHRDIKPENLLFKTKESLSDLVLADFGLSKLMASDKFDLLRTTCGTPGYMAPGEVLRKSGHSKPVDLWSIGVMSYFLLCGYMPFESKHKDNAEELDNIMKGKFSYDPEYWSEISDLGKDFINKLLVVDPANRLTAPQALSHPWMRAGMTPVSPMIKDLLPQVRKGFDGRKVFRRAIDVVKLVNKLSHSPSGSRLQLSASNSAMNLSVNGSSSNLGNSGHVANGMLGAANVGVGASNGMLGASLVPPSFGVPLSKSVSNFSLSEFKPEEDPLTDGHLLVIARPE